MVGNPTSRPPRTTYSIWMDGSSAGGTCYWAFRSQARQANNRLSAINPTMINSAVRLESGICSRSGSSIDALWRRIEGDQDSRLINNVIVVSTENYQEDQSELRGTWNVSPKSIFTGRVTYLDRQLRPDPRERFPRHRRRARLHLAAYKQAESAPHRHAQHSALARQPLVQLQGEQYVFDRADLADNRQDGCVHDSPAHL